MRGMFRSAIFKLTASYVAIAMLICLVCSGVLYHLAVQELHTGFYNEYTRWFNAFEPFGLRQPGTPAGELATRTHHILLQIIWFNVIVLVITTIASYLVARRALDPLESAHELQKRFTADVSHELRTPLTALKMESEVSLLNPKASAKELRATLLSNLEEVERMETLINNLLLLSTMEAKELRTEFKRLELSEVVAAAVSITAKSATLKKIDVSSKLTKQTILGDRASLTQLFVILLENAIKYSPAGSRVAMTMRTSKAARTNPGSVSVNIQDQGQGIPRDALPHIFDRFYRADSARTRESQEGFGLGLSLAKLIADLHNAEIVISSGEGGGTTANIIFSQK